MKCPYCSEEIQDGAVKCRFCGEWLDATKRPSAERAPSSGVQPDYSAFHLYNYEAKGKKKSLKYGSVWAPTDAGARELALQALPPEYQTGATLQLKRQSEGRFTCPRCASRYTICQRDIGCLLTLFIFVSLGLALLIVPLMPHMCECRACANKWKA